MFRFVNPFGIISSRVTLSDTFFSADRVLWEKDNPYSFALPSLQSVVAGLSGLGALALAGQADAAQEVMGQVADGRIGTLALVVVIALGWVGFQIANPALNQLDKMNSEAKSRK